MWKKFLINNLPMILDYACKKLKESLEDEKDTKLDKAVSFLMSEKVKNSIDMFYDQYYKAIIKLK